MIFPFWILDQEIPFPLCFAKKSHVVLVFYQCEAVYTVSSLGEWLLTRTLGWINFQALKSLSDNFCIQFYAWKTRAKVYAVTLKAKLLVGDMTVFLRTSKWVSSLLSDWLTDHKSSKICPVEQCRFTPLASRFVWEKRLFSTHSRIIFVLNLFVKIHTVMFVTLWNTAAFSFSFFSP